MEQGGRRDALLMSVCWVRLWYGRARIGGSLAIWDLVQPNQISEPKDLAAGPGSSNTTRFQLWPIQAARAPGRLRACLSLIGLYRACWGPLTEYLNLLLAA
jgi:hypothetical protein